MIIAQAPRDLLGLFAGALRGFGGLLLAIAISGHPLQLLGKALDGLRRRLGNVAGNFAISARGLLCRRLPVGLHRRCSTRNILIPGGLLPGTLRLLAFLARLWLFRRNGLFFARFRLLAGRGLLPRLLFTFLRLFTRLGLRRILRLLIGRGLRSSIRRRPLAGLQRLGRIAQPLGEFTALVA